jgi:hypothetical protein
MRLARLSAVATVLALTLPLAPAGHAAAMTAPAPGDCPGSWTDVDGREVVIRTHRHAQTVRGTGWSELRCARNTLHVRKGTRAQVIVTVNADIRCVGPGAAANWCGARVLIDGVEAHPGEAGDSDRFAWAIAKPGVRRRHSGTFVRTAVTGCPSGGTAAVCDKVVTVQARNNSAASELWVDGLVVHIESNSFTP